MSGSSEPGSSSSLELHEQLVVLDLPFDLLLFCPLLLFADGNFFDLGFNIEGELGVALPPTSAGLCLLMVQSDGGCMSLASLSRIRCHILVYWRLDI